MSFLICLLFLRIADIFVVLADDKLLVIHFYGCSGKVIQVADKYLSREQWEAVCRRCGRCCFEKIDDEGMIYFTDLACRFLDRDTKLCQVYNHRTEKEKGCVALTPAIVRLGFMPPGCPYIELVTKMDQNDNLPFQETDQN